MRDDRPPLHRAAAQGFQAESAAYERGRPTFPAGAVQALCAALAIAPGKTVIDLGAGTGKLTRLLQPTGARLIAVEPVAAMRERLAAAAPGVEVLDGQAEALPVASASVDAIVCAQALHWFANTPALREMRRVLRPGGALGLMWNIAAAEPWMEAVAAVTEPFAKDAPRYRSFAWRRAFLAPEAAGLFGPLSAKTFEHGQASDADGVVDRMVSISFIAALPRAERDGVAARIRAVLAEHPQTKGLRALTMRYHTDVYWCRAL